MPRLGWTAAVTPSGYVPNKKNAAEFIKEQRGIEGDGLRLLRDGFKKLSRGGN